MIAFNSLRLQRLNRVWVIGRDTYIRAYPNPGIGLKLNDRYRVALSVRGGVEVFKAHPVYVWQRVWSFASRIKRPGAKG